MALPPPNDDDQVRYRYDSTGVFGNGLPSLFFGGPYSAAETNDRNKGKIEKNVENLNKDVEQKLSIARETYKNIPSEVFNYLIEARKAHLPELTEKLVEAHKVLDDPDGKDKRGIPPDRIYVMRKSGIAECEFNRQVDEDVKQKYYASRPNERHEVLDDQIKRAKMAAGLEERGGGIGELFSNAVGSVYDNKNGIRWGGVLGGIAGYIVSNVFGASGMLGTVLALLMTGIGIYMGNKVADNYKNDTIAGSARPPEEKAPAKELEKGQGKEPEKEKGQQPQAVPRSEQMHRMLEQEEIARAKTTQTANRGDLGQLQPQSFAANGRPSADRTLI